MDAYDEIFDDENDEIMRGVRERQSEVAEMYKRFNTDPRLWEEDRKKLKAEGCNFLD